MSAKHVVNAGNTRVDGDAMRVLEVVSTFPPYKGGTGNACFHQSVELMRLGHQVRIITTEGNSEPIRIDESLRGMDVRRLPSTIRIGNSSISRRLLREFDEIPDIVHLHGPYVGNGVLALLASVLKSVPLIYTYHNDIILRGFANLLPRLDVLLPQRMIFGRARAVIFTSLDYACYCAVSALAQQNSEKLRIIPNGVDLNRFRPKNDDGCEMRDYHEKAHKNVLFVGTLDRAHYFKGVDVALRALREMKVENASLSIVGQGDLRAGFMRLADELGVAQRTRFLDTVSDSDLPKTYRESNVLILPSVTMGEAFGIVLLEAMACGKPVVASDLPGVRSVVKDSGAGLLVPPGDHRALAAAIDRLLLNEDMATIMGRKGRSTCEAKYGWQTIGLSLEKTMREVLRGSCRDE